MAEILATPLGPAVGAAPEHGVRFWESRVHQILPIVDQAKARGGLAVDLDPEKVFAFAMGAVHFRMLVIGERVNSTRIDQVVDDVCRLYCRRAQSKWSRR